MIITYYLIITLNAFSAAFFSLPSKEKRNKKKSFHLAVNASSPLPTFIAIFILFSHGAHNANFYFHSSGPDGGISRSLSLSLTRLI